MSEKKKRGLVIKSAGNMRAVKAAGQKGRNMPGTGRRKMVARWFSTDSMIGKMLCILLVIILTVGAFLAPKLINNLYDAGTLMQITYVDMELSPYAVSYASFEDKLKAIARANTAGDHFLTLSAEETEEKISDAELIQIVNREMSAASDGLSLLFYEGWWGELREENLISRERNAIYVQQTGSAADGDSRRETAPIQFWKLTFSAADAAGSAFDWEDLMDSEKEAAAREKAIVSAYTTNRLIVCLDTDFYKIYAVAVEGNGEWIQALYGWNIEELFGLAARGKENGNRYSDIEFGMYMTDQIAACWAEYWGVAPEDKNIYMNIPGELSGCLAFLENAEKAEETAGEEEIVGVEEIFREGEIAEAEETARAGEIAGAENTFGNLSNGRDVMVVENVEDIIYMGDGMRENEILLEVGCQGGWDETETDRWIQKTGCRDFFDVMQF